MKKKPLLLALTLALVPLVVSAADQDDFGTWYELGATKLLPRNFSLGAEAELRLQDGSSKADRLALSLKTEYRAHKHLRLGLGYSFLHGYTPDKMGSKRFTPGYWTPRHRVNLEATGSVKFWRWLRIGLRERYQYTYRPGQTIDRYPLIYDGNGDYTGYDMDDNEPKTRASLHSHRLRSRLKLSLDKKGLKWEPFIAVEAQNELNRKMHLHKVRTHVGTEYKINKQHALSLAYVFSCATDEQPRERQHALSMGYNFKF